MMNPEQIQEMVETFSKATTLISAATSREDMFAVGMMTSIEEHPKPNLPTSGIMS